ncbi:helix-turn-helix transcriptional regulator [Flavobacterium defluvii]|uniref:Transcriptional regulator, AraC family n=1 Tax=Flavobacterium defluvii TaxID=370979 RepID=A0A1M5TRR3_9FLAO|nr:helix-turn-helix domain-containing protein [Flavobacterium defluvii]SHH53350.1 transcriptional regulator, AraC family [Flavobacterium defluvii]
MKIEVVDKNGSGILQKFADAIGASVRGRFIDIPKNLGEGYMTGFTWGNDLRMMIRNYYLKEEIVLERKNEIPEGQENVIFFLSGIFDSAAKQNETLKAEQPNVFIAMQSVSSVIAMQQNTFFRSITISASREYLKHTFGELKHSIVSNILSSKDTFVYEIGISQAMITAASEMIHQSVPEGLDNHFHKLKCEELLCHIFALLLQREESPASGIHINDIKALYAIKYHLQSNLDKAPDIATLAKKAGMSEPKLRKLFRQTFGKGVFEYYQSMRMQEAARLLRESHLSVSEVGYQLGFSNLSHFSRVFEQYIGLKPKKYSVL